jgi:hypothetical protein
MPCAIAEAMLAAASAAPPRIGIITPFTDYIERFFPNLNVQRYKSAPMLELRKYQDGSVNADETAKLVADRFKRLTINWGAAASIIHHETDGSTLFVSCGEPVALRVAKECGCTGIIVTDHLLTLSVRHVLEDGGLLDERTAPIMTEFESWDRSASGAFLSPIEFASPEYTEYLSMGGLHATPISGLFYESINRDAAEGNSAFQEIQRICGETKVACVFAGGGTIWDDIIVNVDERARRGENSGFAVINRKVVDRRPVKGEWLLHMPGNAEPIPVSDPGKMRFIRLKRAPQGERSDSQPTNSYLVSCRA